MIVRQLPVNWTNGTVILGLPFLVFRLYDDNLVECIIFTCVKNLRILSQSIFVFILTVSIQLANWFICDLEVNYIID